MTKKKKETTEEKKNTNTNQQKKNQEEKKAEKKEVKAEKKAEQANDNPENEEIKAEQEVKTEEKHEKTDAEKFAEMNDKYLRLAAEYDNYRKRTLKEKMELSKSAGEDILINILPVMDDFERGLDHMDKAKDIEAVKEGVQLIYNKFKEFLKQRGVKEIEAKEKDFDTDLHEAITKIPAPTDELKGKVVDVVEKGYYLNEKVIRFSKVVIGE
jgi:molecular chaperone GrpE